MKSSQPKTMTFRYVDALTILIAEKLGLVTSTLWVAKNILAGESIHPTYFKQLQIEAATMKKQLICEPSIANQAKVISTQLTAEYGFGAVTLAFLKSA